MTPLGIAEHDEAVDEVLELAHVAGPRTVRYEGERLRQKLPTLTVLAVEPLKEYGGQDRDLLPPLAEGRHVDLHDVQAIVEVLAELAATQGELQVSIGRGHDPGVDQDGFAAADSRELQILDDVEEFRLEGEGEFADLVQVDGPFVRQLEHPQLSPGGPGERSFFVAEEFRFQEPGGEGGTVHLDKRPVRSRGRRMDRARHEVLADPALPAKEDRRVDARDLFDHLPDRPHLSAVSQKRGIHGEVRLAEHPIHEGDGIRTWRGDEPEQARAVCSAGAEGAHRHQRRSLVAPGETPTGAWLGDPMPGKDS